MGLKFGIDGELVALLLFLAIIIAGTILYSENIDSDDKQIMVFQINESYKHYGFKPEFVIDKERCYQPEQCYGNPKLNYCEFDGCVWCCDNICSDTSCITEVNYYG